jgi:hypothetical protein
MVMMAGNRTRSKTQYTICGNGKKMDACHISHLKEEVLEYGACEWLKRLFIS